MAQGFNLTAEINLRGPSNIRTVVADIRRQIGSVSVTLNPTINRSSIRTIASDIRSQLGSLNIAINVRANANSIRAIGADVRRQLSGVVVPVNIRANQSSISQTVTDIRRRLSSINANVNVRVNASSLTGVNTYNTNIRNLNNTLAQTVINATNATASINALTAAMRGASSVRLQPVSGNLGNIGNTARTTANNVALAGSEIESFGRQAGLAIRRFTAFSTVAGVVYGITNAVKNGVSAFIEYDRQLTRISQVTGDAKNSLGKITSEIDNLSKSLGVSSSELATTSVTLAQAGLSARDTERALKALALSALAPSFDDMNQTVEGSIALMRQFSISSAQLEGALGSINSVAAKFAVEASDIITAIQRTGGVFAAASRGVSTGTEALNEFIAVFTSIRATTRESAETIATGLRTIFTRIQRADTIDALKEFGVTLTDLEGKFVGPYIAVQRLSEGLSRLDPRDLKFSQIVEELGGFRQIGKVLPLIQQFSTAQEALKVAQSGQGSLAVDAAKGQQALAVQISKVRQEFLALIRSIGNTDSFQNMVTVGLNLASALIKVADATKGLIPLMALFAAFKGAQAVTQFAGGFGRGFRGAPTGGQRASEGGPIRRFASGGYVAGFGNGDTVSAKLTPGEFVLRKSAVQSIGVGNLQSLNRNSGGPIQKFSEGGGSKSAKGAYFVNPGDKDTELAHVTPSKVSLKVLSDTQHQIQTKKGGNRQLAYDRSSYFTEQVPIIVSLPRLANQNLKLETGVNSLSLEQWIKQNHSLLLRTTNNDNKKLRRSKARIKLDNLIDGDSTSFANSFAGSIGALQKTSVIDPDIALAFGRVRSMLRKQFIDERSSKADISFRGLGKEELIRSFGNLPAESLQKKLKRGGARERLEDQSRSKMGLATVGYTAGGPIQRFPVGGVVKPVSRTVGVIDFDDWKEDPIVAAQMKTMGITKLDEYKVHMSNLVAEKRKSGRIRRLRTVFGVAASGKTTAAYGGERSEEVDNARLRKTTRRPIRVPSDLEGLDEVIDTTSVLGPRNAASLRASDRIRNLSSRSKASQEAVVSRRKNRDRLSESGIPDPSGRNYGLFNRRPGATDGAPADTGIDEAWLAASEVSGVDRKKVITTDVATGRRIGAPTVRTPEKTTVFSGNVGPVTSGHVEAIMKGSKKAKTRPEDTVIYVAGNTPIDPFTRDDQRERTAIFPQTSSSGPSRVGMAQAVLGSKGFNISAAPKGIAPGAFPKAFKIAGQEDSYIVPKSTGNAAIIGNDKPDSTIERNRAQGYEPIKIARNGISGTDARVAIMSNDIKAMERLLTPEGIAYLKPHMATLQKRPKLLDSILARIQQNAQKGRGRAGRYSSSLAELSTLPARVTAKTPSDVANRVKELREQRDTDEAILGRRAARMLPKIERLGRSSGGAIQRFMAGGVTEEPDVAMTTKASTGDIIKLLGIQRAAAVGGIRATDVYAALKTTKPTPQQAASKAAILAEFTKQKTALASKAAASQTRKQNKATAKGLVFGAAGLFGSAFATQPVIQTIQDTRLKDPTKQHTVSIYSGVYKNQKRASSIDASFDKAVDTIPMGQAKKEKRAEMSAQKKKVRSVLGGFESGRELALDFDRTLAFGADKILADPKKPRFSEFSDTTKVTEALGKAKLSILGRQLVSLVAKKPELLKNIRIITARPAATLPLIQTWLTSKGLPIQASQFKGLGGPTISGSDIAKLKAAELSPGSIFVDDDKRNTAAARKRADEGIDIYRYRGVKKLKENTQSLENIESLKGNLLEAFIRRLGAVGSPKGNGFDFMTGLGRVSQKFEPKLPPNIPTDVKRTLAGPSTIKDNIVTYLKNVKGYSAGGGTTDTVPALVSNGEAYIPPEEARNIGLGKLREMNQADRNGMGSFARGGGVSVFRGPGTGTSDSIGPIGLPVGSFIVRAAATKALGLSGGGPVQRFFLGGGPRVPARPGAQASLENVRITDGVVTQLNEITEALTQLGVASSSSAEIIRKGGQISSQAAITAYEADILRLRVSGAPMQTVIEAETRLANMRQQAATQVRAQRQLAGVGGAQLEDIDNNAQQNLQAIVQRRRARGGEVDENFMRGAESVSYTIAARRGGLSPTQTAGLNGNDLRQYINTAMGDPRTFEQMNRAFESRRRGELETQLRAERTATAGRTLTTREVAAANREARTLARQEADTRRATLNETRGANGPGGGTSRGQALMGGAFGIQMLGSLMAQNINADANRSNAQMSAGISGGTAMVATSAMIAGGVAESPIGTRIARALGPNMTALAGSFAVVAVAGAAVGQALIDARNAAIEFDKKLAGRKAQDALEDVAKSFELLSKDIKNVNIQQDISKSLLQAGRYTTEATTVEDRIPKAFWLNITDALGSRDQKAAAERSQILEKKGIFDYLASTDTFGNKSYRSMKMGELNIDKARDQSKQFAPIADNINKLIDEKLRGGSNVRDITSGADFEQFAEIISKSNQNINEQILQMQTSGVSDAEIKDLKMTFATSEINKRSSVIDREKSFKDLDRSTNILSRSLERMFQNMEQAINKTSFGLEQMSKDIELVSSSLQGQAKIGSGSLKSINVLQNPRAYSESDRNNARNQASSFFSGNSNTMKGLLTIGDNIEGTILSTINKTIKENPGATNEKMSSQIQNNIQAQLDKLNLPSDISSKLSEQIKNALNDLSKNGDEKVDFSQLIEKIPQLSKTVDSSRRAQETALKALEHWQNALNSYSEKMNQLLELQVDTNAKLLKSTQIVSDANMELAKALGKTVEVSEVRRNVENQTSFKTGGLTKPQDISRQILALENQRQNQENASDVARNAGPGAVNDFMKMQDSLRNTNVALRDSYEALKHLAENTEVASAALNKAQEAQQKNQGRVSFIEKLVTSTPEEFDSLRSAFGRLQRNMNGQINTIQNSSSAQKAYFEALNNGASGFEAMRAAQAAFANDRKETLGAMNDILPLLGDSKQAGNIKANVLESMLQESGVGTSPVFQQILNTLRNPEADPETQAAMAQYQQAINTQVAANNELAKLNNNLGAEIANKSATALKEALAGAIITFKNAELVDIAADIKALRSDFKAPGVPAAGKASGGVIYAAAGMGIDFSPRGTDTVPAMLTPGEFVVNRSATQANLPLLQNINSGKYSSGGKVSYYADGGYVSSFMKPSSEDAEGFKQTKEKYFAISSTNDDILKEASRRDVYLGPTIFTSEVNDSKTPSDPKKSALSKKLNFTKLSTTSKPIPGWTIGFHNFGRDGFSESGVNVQAFEPTNAEKALSRFRKLSDNNAIFLASPDSKNFETENILNKDKEQYKTSFNEKYSRYIESVASGAKIQNLLSLIGSAKDYPSSTAATITPNEIDTVFTNRAPAGIYIDKGGSSPSSKKSNNIIEAPVFNLWKNSGSLENAYSVAKNKPKYSDVWSSYDFKPVYTGHDAEMYPGIAENANYIKQSSEIEKMIEFHEKQAEVFKKSYRIANGRGDFSDTERSQSLGKYEELQNKISKIYNGFSPSEDLTEYKELFRYPGRLESAKSFIVLAQSSRDILKDRIEQLRGGDLGDKAFGLAGIKAQPRISNTEIDFANPKARADKKYFPWMINEPLADLGEEFKKRQKEGILNELNNGPIKTESISKQAIKLALPVGNGNSLDVMYDALFTKYSGPFFDQKTMSFDDANRLDNIFIPEPSPGIFKQLNTSLKRLYGDDLSEFEGQGIAKKIIPSNSVKKYIDAIKNKENPQILEALANKVKNDKNSIITFGKSLLPSPNNPGDLMGNKYLFSRKGDQFKLNIGEYLVSAIDGHFQKNKTAAGNIIGSIDNPNQLSDVVGDKDIGTALKTLTKGALNVFGRRPIPGFSNGWLFKELRRFGGLFGSGGKNEGFIRDGGVAKNISSYIANVFNNAGGGVSQLFKLSRNLNQYQNLKEAYVLMSGAWSAFSGLANGNTRFIKTMLDGGGNFEDLFRSLGASASFQKAATRELSPDFKAELGPLLEGSKIRKIGANGSLTYEDFTDQVPKNYQELVDLALNPYNEFPNTNVRKTLIEKLRMDILNGKDSLGMPFYDPRTSQYIDNNLTALQKWYGGEGLWPGQDSFYDTNLPVDTRQKSLIDALKNGQAGDIYTSAEKANTQLGLASKYGNLPQDQWFEARSQGEIQPQKRASGGLIYAANGALINFAPQGTDTVPAMLTPGEFVVNRAATQANLPLLQSINKSKGGKVNYYAAGGMTSLITSITPPSSGDNAESSAYYRNIQQIILTDKLMSSSLSQVSEETQGLRSNINGIRQNGQQVLSKLPITKRSQSTSLDSTTLNNIDKNTRPKPAREVLGGTDEMGQVMNALEIIYERSADSASMQQSFDDIREDIKIATKDIIAVVADPISFQNAIGLNPAALKVGATSANAAGRFARGGVVYAANGTLIPYQPRGTDTVPAMLTPGEFVVNRSAAQANLPLLQSINKSKGGIAYLQKGGRPKVDEKLFPRNHRGDSYATSAESDTPNIDFSDFIVDLDPLDLRDKAISTAEDIFTKAKTIQESENLLKAGQHVYGEKAIYIAKHKEALLSLEKAKNDNILINKIYNKHVKNKSNLTQTRVGDKDGVLDQLFSGFDNSPRDGEIDVDEFKDLSNIDLKLLGAARDLSALGILAAGGKSFAKEFDKDNSGTLNASEFRSIKDSVWMGGVAAMDGNARVSSLTNQVEFYKTIIEHLDKGIQVSKNKTPPGFNKGGVVYAQEGKQIPDSTFNPAYPGLDRENLARVLTTKKEIEEANKKNPAIYETRHGLRMGYAAIAKPDGTTTLEIPSSETLASMKNDGWVDRAGTRHHTRIGEIGAPGSMPPMPGTTIVDAPLHERMNAFSDVVGSLTFGLPGQSHQPGLVHGPRGLKTPLTGASAQIPKSQAAEAARRNVRLSDVPSVADTKIKYKGEIGSREFFDSLTPAEFAKYTSRFEDPRYPASSNFKDFVDLRTSVIKRARETKDSKIFENYLRSTKLTAEYRDIDIAIADTLSGVASGPIKDFPTIDAQKKNYTAQQIRDTRYVALQKIMRESGSANAEKIVEFLRVDSSIRQQDHDPGSSYEQILDKLGGDRAKQRGRWYFPANEAFSPNTLRTYLELRAGEGLYKQPEGADIDFTRYDDMMIRRLELPESVAKKYRVDHLRYLKTLENGLHTEDAIAWDGISYKVYPGLDPLAEASMNHREEFLFPADIAAEHSGVVPKNMLIADMQKALQSRALAEAFSRYRAQMGKATTTEEMPVALDAINQEAIARKKLFEEYEAQYMRPAKEPQMKARGGIVYAQDGLDPSKQRMPTLFDLPRAFSRSQTQKPYEPDVKPKSGLAGASIGAPKPVSAIAQRDIDRKVWENTPQDKPYWFGTKKEDKYEMRSRAIETSLDEGKPEWYKNAGTAWQMVENLGSGLIAGGGRGASTNNGGIYRVGQGFGENKPQTRPSTPRPRTQLPESRPYIPTRQPSLTDRAYREWQESQSVVAGQKPLSQDSRKPSGLLSAILDAGLKTTSPTRSDQKSPQQEASEIFRNNSIRAATAPLEPERSLLSTIRLSEKAQSYAKNMTTIQRQSLERLVSNAPELNRETLLTDIVEKMAATNLRWAEGDIDFINATRKAEIATDARSFTGSAPTKYFNENKLPRGVFTGHAVGEDMIGMSDRAFSSISQSPQAKLSALLDKILDSNKPQRQDRSSVGVHETAHLVQHMAGEKADMNGYPKLLEIVKSSGVNLDEFLAGPGYREITNVLGTNYVGPRIKSLPFELFTTLNQAKSVPETRGLFDKYPEAQKVLDALWKDHIGKIEKSKLDNATRAERMKAPLRVGPAPPPPPPPPKKYSTGGMIYASTGTLVNYQPRGTDTVPAMLTPGEFVVNARATQQHLPLLQAINGGADPSETSHFARGGLVGLLKRKNTVRSERAAASSDATGLWVLTDENELPYDTNITAGIPIEKLMDTPISKIAKVNSLSKRLALAKIKEKQDNAGEFPKFGDQTDIAHKNDTVVKGSVIARKIGKNTQTKTDDNVVLDELAAQIAARPLMFDAKSYSSANEKAPIDKANDILAIIKGQGANRNNPNDPLNQNRIAFINAQGEWTKASTRLDYLNQVISNTAEGIKTLNGNVGNRSRDTFAAANLPQGTDIGGADGLDILTAQNSRATAERDYIQQTWAIIRNDLGNMSGQLQDAPGMIYDETTFIPQKFNRGGIVYAAIGGKAGKTKLTPEEKLNKQRKIAIIAAREARARIREQYFKIAKQIGASTDEFEKNKLNIELTKLQNEWDAVDSKVSDLGQQLGYKKDQSLKKTVSDIFGQEIVMGPNGISVTRKKPQTLIEIINRDPEIANNERVRVRQQEDQTRLTGLERDQTAAKESGVSLATYYKDNPDAEKKATEGGHLGSLESFRNATTFTNSQGQEVDLNDKQIAHRQKIADRMESNRKDIESFNNARKARLDKEQKAEQMSTGGLIYAATGTLVPYQPRGTDTVPAMLTPGEFVVNRAATQANLPLLQSINSGSYSSGGMIKYLAEGGSPGDLDREEQRKQALAEKRAQVLAQKQAEREQRAQDEETRLKNLEAQRQQKSDAYNDAMEARRQAFINAREQKKEAYRAHRRGENLGVGNSYQQQTQTSQSSMSPAQTQSQQMSPQVAQRVSIASQEAFNPQNYGDVNKQLVIFGTLMTGINQVLTQFGAVLTQMSSMNPNQGGGVNNNKSPSIEGLDGLSQFTTKFEQFISQLKSINPVINMQGTHTVVVEFGASAGVFKGMEEGLQRFVVGQVNAALSNVNHTLMNSTEGSIGHVEHLA
jgi:TP901 family phage tail tape measure protein